MAFRVEMLFVHMGSLCDIGGGQEQAASFLCDPRADLLQGPACLNRLPVKGRILLRLPNVRPQQERGDEQDPFRREESLKTAEALFQPAADQLRGGAKDGLAVVGAEHQDDGGETLRLPVPVNGVDPFPTGTGRIPEDGCPSADAVLQDPVSKWRDSFPQNTRPADMFRISFPGPGNQSPGVGVPEGEYMLHAVPSFFIRPARRLPAPGCPRNQDRRCPPGSLRSPRGRSSPQPAL